MGLKLIISLSFCILLSGCDLLIQQEEAEALPPLTVPEDQATEAERGAVEDSIDLISKYAKEYGIDVNFRRLPIILRARDNPAENVAGRCHYDYDLQGHYIEIFKDVVPIGLGRREAHFASELFVVLLHEIGHCYFSRPHENTMIRRADFEMVFSIPSGGINGEIFFPELPATIMVDTWSVGIPKSLERYYVGEVLGLIRANSPEELQNYASFRIRHKDEAHTTLPPNPEVPGDPVPGEPTDPNTPQPEPTPVPEEDDNDWWPPWPTPSDPETPGTSSIQNKKGIRFCADPDVQFN